MINATLARQQSRWTRALSVVAAVVSALALTVGTSTAAQAATALPAGDQQTDDVVFCTTFPGSSNPNATVTAGLEAPIGTDNGFAIWHAYGDWLEVIDTKSDGHRMVALFSYCVDGHWHPNLQLDSGPDEGSHDREKYKFNFAEGRAVKVELCERNRGYPMRCGTVKESHA